MNGPLHECLLSPGGGAAAPFLAAPDPRERTRRGGVSGRYAAVRPWTGSGILAHEWHESALPMLADQVKPPEGCSVTSTEKYCAIVDESGAVVTYENRLP